MGISINQQKGETPMSQDKSIINNSIVVVNQICAGIDIHRDTANITLLYDDSEGQTVKEYREYRTHKANLMEMKEWLVEHHCLVVGMESTSKYWHPVHNVLEDQIKVLLYNARNVKNIPGKKTDKSDSEWIANITRYNLIKGSFIPHQIIRDTRLLSRTRTEIQQSRTRLRQCIHGILQSAGIKLSSNMSDIFGKSGLNLLNLLSHNRNYNEAIIEKSVYGPLQKKVKLLMDSMDGYMRPAHRLALRQTMEATNQLTVHKEVFEKALCSFLIQKSEQQSTFDRLKQIPGFSDISALLLLSEIGFNLDSFARVEAFCSWAGVCPGNKESAGKKLSGKIYTKKHNVKTLLIEVAWVSVKMKETYYSAKFLQLRARKGPNKAIVAIAHKIAKAAFAIIKYGRVYIELTPAHINFNNINRSTKLVKQAIQCLGLDAVKELINTETTT